MSGRGGSSEWKRWGGGWREGKSCVLGSGEAGWNKRETENRVGGGVGRSRGGYKRHYPKWSILVFSMGMFLPSFLFSSRVPPPSRYLKCRHFLFGHSKEREKGGRCCSHSLPLIEAFRQEAGNCLSAALLGIGFPPSTGVTLSATGNRLRPNHLIYFHI